MSAPKDDWIRLSDVAWLFRGDPDPPTTALTSTDPNVVIIFGWMDAQVAHLHKYTAVHRSLYPNASIVLVASRGNLFYRGKAYQEKRLAPVVEALQALNCFSPQSTISPPRILVHSFSNGGASQVKVLSDLLKAKKITSPPTQSAMIFDSSPAFGSLRHAMFVFSAQLRNPIARIMMKLFVGVFLGSLIAVTSLLRVKVVTKKIEEAVLQPNVLPFLSKDSPRLYIYSKADQAVPWEGVQDHADKAAGLGVDVRTEVFEDTGHVSHARAHPDRYWSAVKRLWADTLTKKP